MAILEGKAYWASITVPNTNFEHVYTVNLVVDQPVADDFKSRGFTIKDMEEGPALIIKRKVNGPNGMIRPAPKLFDRFKNPVSYTVGNGSTVKVQYREWESTWKGKDFRGLDLQAVQVINLIESTKNIDGAEFEVEDDSLEEII